jgi:DNA-binding MarR family transcriptional regulator
MDTSRDDRRADLTQRIVRAEEELHAVVVRWLEPVQMPADLTLRQVQVLALVRAAPDATGQELARVLDVSTPTMSGILERIVTRGWLDRRPDPSDRRRHLLQVTGEGEAVLAALEGPPRKARARLLEELEVDELDDLGRLVGRMLEAGRRIAEDDASAAAARTGPDEARDR